ncbi:zinc finger, CCHC-type containing protein [Tanacetum coccineum]
MAVAAMSVVFVITTHIPEMVRMLPWDKSGRGPSGTMMTMFAEDSLEAKYIADDASSKKFFVTNFTNYKMIDSRPIMEQYNELFDFKHKKQELTLVELGSHLHIEESLKAQDSDKPKGNNVVGPAVVRLPDPKLKTLGEIVIECIFVRYVEHSAAFSIPKGTEDIGVSVVPEEVIEEVVQQPESELRKSKRNRTPKNFRHEFQLYLIEGTRDEVLADLPPSCKPLGCKWIFKIKLKVDGTIEKFKARLVIQGFKQKSGIDYFDTYAPVERISTIRLLIAMASIHNMVIHQMDVKTAFVNGDLDEEVYMNQPRGFIMPGNENKVDLTKDFLSSRFSMKDMGEADVILGIRIEHESNGIAISQSHYIENVLKKFNYLDCTPVSTPMDTSEKLMPNNGQVISQLEYSRVICCLMYATTCTRPDIAFAVGKLSRYTSNPSPQHWQAIQQDARWISNSEDNSSTSGWVFLFGGGVISWVSNKQTCITSSTMESEFMDLATAGKEAEWLRNLILEISLRSKPIAPISIRCDSAAILSKTYSQMYNGKSRHLGVRHNMIPELITNGVVSIEFVRGLKHMYLHIIPRMCLEPAEKEDEVVNFLMVNFFEKVLSRSMNKEEPPMYSNGLKGSILRTP